jgi:replicative DNA helicase
MPDKTEGKLKLIHVIWTLLAAAVLVGVAGGAIKNQQKTNTEQIKQQQQSKVEKEVFEMHQNQQNQQFKDIKETMKNGFDKIDGTLKEIQQKI